MTEAEKPWMTPAEVAQRMKVSPITVRGWSQKGLLEAEITPGGHRRYSREVVERFARSVSPAGNPAGSPADKHKPLRILIVDDDQTLLGFLVELLGDQDGRTLLDTAFDGFEAGQKLVAFRPDVVLLDLMMPGMRGTEVCKRIKGLSDHAGIRVFGMSGYLTPENEQELLAAGAERCFAKPLDTDLLLQALGLAD